MSKKLSSRTKKPNQTNKSVSAVLCFNVTCVDDVIGVYMLYYC